MEQGAQGPRTMNAAVAALMLGEIDGLVKRIEVIAASVAGAEAQVSTKIAALDAASEKFRDAVAAFTDEAKAETASFIERRVAEVVAKTAEEQRGAMQEAARLAFRGEAVEKAARLGDTLSAAVDDFRKGTWWRLVEHGVTAIAASVLTSVLLYAMFAR